MAAADDIGRLLKLVRQRKFAQALSEVEPLRAAAPPEQAPLWNAVQDLLKWYARSPQQHYAPGLQEAMVAVLRLRDEGFEALIAWDLASVGYALGTLGDLETGIAWLDRAIDLARSQSDGRGLIFFMAPQGCPAVLRQRIAPSPRHLCGSLEPLRG